MLVSHPPPSLLSFLWLTLKEISSQTVYGWYWTWEISMKTDVVSHDFVTDSLEVRVLVTVTTIRFNRKWNTDAEDNECKDLNEWEATLLSSWTCNVLWILRLDSFKYRINTNMEVVKTPLVQDFSVVSWSLLFVSLPTPSVMTYRYNSQGMIS